MKISAFTILLKWMCAIPEWTDKNFTTKLLRLQNCERWMKMNMWRREKQKEEWPNRTSLVAQWWRVHASVQEVQVWSLGWGRVRIKIPQAWRCGQKINETIRERPDNSLLREPSRVFLIHPWCDRNAKTSFSLSSYTHSVSLGFIFILSENASGYLSCRN